jgi:hypothetical protein
MRAERNALYRPGIFPASIYPWWSSMIKISCRNIKINFFIYWGHGMGNAVDRNLYLAHLENNTLHKPEIFSCLP